MYRLQVDPTFRTDANELLHTTEIRKQHGATAGKLFIARCFKLLEVGQKPRLLQGKLSCRPDSLVRLTKKT